VTTLHAPTEWQLERLDLDAYLDRIGLDAVPPTTPRGLRRIHRAHALSIPFENLDILLGRGVDLDLDSIQAKLVGRRRGGYCYEHNLLFGAALERLGFGVLRLAARVRMGATAVRPRSHMLMRVEAEGIAWLADVGFGGEGIIDAIPFADGAVTSNPDGWNHGIASEPEGDWVLRSLHPDGWFDLYAIGPEPQHLVDYEVASYYLSTHPRSPFVTTLVAQRSAPDMRLTLTERRLVESRPDGTEEVTELDASGLVETLRERFGIPLDDEEAARLAGRPPRS
jgi:N-hydroxyarylamine O-acetyltransferase